MPAPAKFEPDGPVYHNSTPSPPPTPYNWGSPPGENLGGAAEAAKYGPDPSQPWFNNPQSMPGRWNTPAPSPMYPLYQPPQPPPRGTLQDPGIGETTGTNNLDWFFSPTQSAQDYGKWSSMFESMANQSVPSFAAGAYGNANLSTSANLDPYYKQAWQTGSDRLNRQLAARGLGNSGAAVEALQGLSGQLGAEQANREADYRLRRAQTLGGLAQGASSEALAGTGQRLGAASAGAGLAAGVDAAELNRRGAGINTAFGVQGAQETREGDAFNRISGAASEQANVFLDSTLRAIAGDADLAAIPFEIKMAAAQMAMQGDQQGAQNILSLASTGASLLG